MMLCGKKNKAPVSEDDTDDRLIFTGSSRGDSEDLPSPPHSLSPILAPRDDWCCVTGLTGKRKLAANNLGQLRLSVYANFGLLTVHVIEGRQMCCRRRWASATGGVYVKVCISPDESRRTKCRTSLVPASKGALFNEKFSFELLEDDIKKRLLMSVWFRDDHTDRSQFLGCMSFGLQHVISQQREVNGWYHLLEEGVGRRKHLHVAGTTTTASAHAGDPQCIPKINQDLVWMEPKVLAIRRVSDESYGFSVLGCSPVLISRVESGSPAADAGLRVGDCIVGVNGMNLSRSTAESVAKIVSNLAVKIMMEVQRPRGSAADGTEGRQRRRRRRHPVCLSPVSDEMPHTQRAHLTDHFC